MTILYTSYRESNTPYEPFEVGEGVDLSDEDLAYLSRRDLVFKVPTSKGFVFASGTGKDYILHLLKVRAAVTPRKGLYHEI